MKRIPFPHSEICQKCAKKLGGNTSKRGIGMWPGICPVCKRKTNLADPFHDFGITLVEKVKLESLKHNKKADL